MVEYIGSLLNLLPSGKHYWFEKATWYCVVKLPNNAKGCGMHFTHRNKPNDKTDWHEINKVYTEVSLKDLECEHNPSIINKIKEYFNINLFDLNNIFVFTICLQGRDGINVHNSYRPYTGACDMFDVLDTNGIEFALYYTDKNNKIIWNGHNYEVFWQQDTKYLYEIDNINITFNYFDVDKYLDVSTEYVMKNCGSCH